MSDGPRDTRVTKTATSMAPHTRAAAARRSRVTSSPASTGRGTVPSDFGVTTIVVALVLVNLAGKLGDAFAPVLVEQYPLALLALNANDIHMTLTAGHINALAYVLVCLTRRLVEDPLYFYLGRKKFESAVRILDGIHPGVSSKVNVMKPWFARYSSWAVLLEPGAVVCLLAGWSELGRVRFWSVNVFGTLARIFLVRWFGVNVKTWSVFLTAKEFAHTHVQVITWTTFFVSLFAIGSLVKGAVRAFRKKNNTPNVANIMREMMGPRMGFRTFFFEYE